MFNFAWLIAIAGTIIAIGVWLKTKRVGPPLVVIAGGIVILALADATTLTSIGGYLRTLINQSLSKFITLE